MLKRSRHLCNSYSFITIGPNGDKVPELSQFYRGSDPAKHCLQGLQFVACEIKARLQAHLGAPKLTADQKSTYQKTTLCHLCGKDGMTKYNGKKLQPSDRVRDHCHVSGKFRGAARSQSNLQARNNYEIPIFVHNLKGYDAHLLFEELGSSTDGNLSVIVTNNEKYVSFAVTQKFTPEEIAMMKDDTTARKTKPWKLTFKDGCQFLLASLDKLVKTLRDEDFKHTSQLADEYGVPLHMLRKKGLYPYEWVDSQARFAETGLPARECFYSKLADEMPSEKEYKHALKVWQRTGCKTFGDYHDLYLKLDVALSMPYSLDCSEPWRKVPISKPQQKTLVSSDFDFHNRRQPRRNEQRVKPRLMATVRWLVVKLNSNLELILMEIEADLKDETEMTNFGQHCW